MKYHCISLYMQTAWHSDIPFREGVCCEKSSLQIICHKNALFLAKLQMGCLC